MPVKIHDRSSKPKAESRRRALNCHEPERREGHLCVDFSLVQTNLQVGTPIEREATGFELEHLFSCRKI